MIGAGTSGPWAVLRAASTSKQANNRELMGAKVVKCIPSLNNMSTLRRLARAALLLLIALGAHGQSIVTVAGGGSDDGQLATNIALNGPSGLALDGAGNLYVAESSQGLVRRINLATGTVETVAGIGAAGYGGDNGPARKATLKEPNSLFLAQNGDLYIADTGNGRVRKIDGKTGIITTVAGRGLSERADGTIGDNGPATEAVLRGPWGVWIDRGNLYITEVGFKGQRVRKMVLSTGIITTIAGAADGSAGYSGDGGPAINATLFDPLGIITDSAGNIFIADASNHVVRRIDATSGNIETYAGGGTSPDDGVAARAADIDPTVMAFDRDGNLLIDTAGRIRRVDKSTRTISTLTGYIGFSHGLVVDAAGNLFVSSEGFAVVLKFTSASTTDFTTIAGGGHYVGDGLPAAAAILRSPQGLAVDNSGNLFIADAFNLLVRRVDATTGLISTYAGSGDGFNDNGEDGTPATENALLPVDIAFDANGDLYIADPARNNRIKKVDAKSGILTFYAGSGEPFDANTNNENVPALQAKFSYPVGIAFDPAGNLYIADRDAHRIWKLSAATRTISTFAGNGKEGDSGDGGAATAAALQDPVGVVFDSSNNAYIADHYPNSRIRKVTPNGMISAFAGGGSEIGDGGPASQALVPPGHLAIDRARGKLYVADYAGSRLRVIDLATSTINTVAGSGSYIYSQGNFDVDFSGDNGPAKDAKLNFPFGLSGVGVDRTGNLFIADSSNNRVRAVFACVAVTAPTLTAPINGATNTTTAPSLSWSSVSGAFRYDLRLDIVSPPVRVIASDLTETSFTPSNLAPGTRYFWSVTAKGDTFCPTLSTAATSISSFTTATGCGAGPFDIIAPAEGSTNVNASALTLAWNASPGAGSYDVYLGAANPPPLVASGVAQPSFSTTTPDRILFWFVVAHATCDPTKTASTPIHTFSTNVSRICGAPGTITQTSPSAGASGVSTTVDLVWSVSGQETPDSFDVYFGTAASPSLLRSDLPRDARSISLPPLDNGTTYFWRVVGKGVCFPAAGASTAVASFTTRTICTAPGSTQIIFAPSSVSTGATYTIVWSVASGLDVDGGYLVERSTSSSFVPILDSQITSSTAASFIAGSPGAVFHRVRALPACDPTKSSPISDAKSVNVTNAPSNIIFTVQPAGVVTSLGEKIEDRRGTFTLENIGATPAQIIVGQSELPGSRPFFSIAEGGAFVTLQPRAPRTFNIQYSGPPNDASGSYQGVIFAVGVTQPLAVTPYAFVNLKVGGVPAVAPQFVIDGTPGDYVALPGFSGDDDSNRPGRDITIRNPGTAPMDLAAEVGPDVWLVPENGWNSQPLAANASRSFKLSTRRPFAPSGSPLPRYTYFTVRTKDGASARLLVQDNDRVAVSGGRSTALDVSARSFVIPEAVSQTVSGGRAVTRLRLTNSGGDSVQVELLFTPSGADGFDAAAVKRAVVVVPPNDVVTLTDPLIQVFGGSDGAAGQIEVRVPRERLGLIAVTASTVFLGSGSTAIIPVVTRSEGARMAAPHVIYLPPAPGATTTLTLAETSGLDKVTVRVVSDSGQTIAQDVPRYGMKRFSVNTGSRLEIDVDAGGGSIIGLATITSGNSNATVLSRALNDRVGATALARAFFKTKPEAVPSITTVVAVISGSSSAGNAPSYKTAVGLVAQSAQAAFTATFYPAGGGVALNRSVTVAAGQTTIYTDVMRDLFAVTTPSDGNLFLQGPTNGKVYAVLQTATSGGTTTPASFLPLPTTLSEALTSLASAAHRPLFLDGLEQSVDATRGTRWMLLLNEVGGASGFVNVRLYEAGNRSRPIAEKDVSVGPNQQVKLDTVFSALGLDAADRRKDRTNVELVITPTGGSARVAASAVSIDNASGDTKMYALTPVVGSGTPNITLATPVLTYQPPSSSPSRHRSVRH